jgi:single-stranded-DNA-specific exonuclease
LPLLKAHLLEIAADQLPVEDLRPSVAIDAEVALGDLDWAIFELLQQLEPTGHANPQPVLMSRQLRVQEARRVGSDGGHLKLTVTDPGAGPRQETAWDAIAFRQGYWFEHLPETVDLAYTLERNVWNGQPRRQLNVVDIRPTDQGAG